MCSWTWPGIDACDDAVVAVQGDIDQCEWFAKSSGREGATILFEMIYELAMLAGIERPPKQFEVERNREYSLIK